MHAKSTHSVVCSIAIAFGVFAFAAPSAFAYEDSIGWRTNSYFKAEAVSGVGQYINGEWTLNPPVTNQTTFSIDSTGTVFHVAQDGTTSTRKGIKVECDLNFDSFYYLDDITNDVLSAIAAVSLVTNEETSATNWMVLKNGKDWVTVATATADASLGSYKALIELDYYTAPPQVRYSVKKSGGEWVTLKEGETEWFSTAAAAPIMSNVCFVGKTTLTSIDAQLATTAAAEVNETDYATVLDAIAAAKQQQNTIVLYKDVAVTTAQLKGNSYAGADYTFNANGKALELTLTKWKVSDETGVDASYSDSTLSVSAVTPLAASIGDTESDTEAYLTLAAAFTAAKAGDKVIVLNNIAENATVSKNITLDLNGKTVTKAADTSAILTVSGSSIFVYGGAITGATAYAAISATGASVVTIDELVATNNAKAIAVAGTSTAVISNGVYAGSFEATDTAKINILGGYIVKDASFTENKVEATGGKFTDETKGVAASPSILASGYQFVAFAEGFVTNGVTFTYEVMTNATGGTSDTKVFSVVDDNGEKSIGGVQIPSSWAETATKETEPAAQQEALNSEVTYKGDQKIKMWECYVIGIDDTSKMSEGPVVKGVQNASSGKIGFTIADPSIIKAKESGCDVKFTVTPCDNPDLSGAGDESAKVDYDKTIEIDPPTSGVKYYKLKMYISTKK